MEDVAVCPGLFVDPFSVQFVESNEWILEPNTRSAID